ncbi:MAG: response regulator [Spirochaetes bacterium]|jgi:two-component system nitrogen regulation response regulator NtrX|nr:response regulator [Spirochaetota bacterium]
MSTILVVDDEEGIREVLSAILDDEGYEVRVAADGVEGLALMESESVDLVLLDVWLPNMGGIDVLKKIKEDSPEIPTIIISGHGSIDIAVKAVKLGAFDFLEKPLSLERVTTAVKNALELQKLRRENRALRSTIERRNELLGESEALQRIRAVIEQAGNTGSRILITGENGTGKELVARAVHRRSDRADRPFVEVNCAAIPDTLIESELFGHEKGAFTHAVSRRRGKFEMADGGTIFLDEVADMSLSAQAKVLRVIQEMRFERVGGEESLEVDVRVIAATNRDIQAEIAAGNFREDLYFRLNVIPIHVPPLRDRPEDLEPLANHFLKEFDPTDGEQPKRISEEGMELLRGYEWPGNVRELKNFIERITIMSDADIVGPDTIREHMGEVRVAPESGEFAEYDGMSLSDARDRFERKYIVQKLEENGYNISRAAQALSVYPSNLHGKIKKFGIEMQK